MAGFDIAPAEETVTLRGNKYKVLGLDIEEVAHIFQKFPEARTAFGAGNTNVQDIIKMSKPLVNGIIVFGLREVTSASIEQSVANLTLGEKAKVLAAIVRLTMPDGLGPFVEVMSALGLLSEGAGPVTQKGPIRLRTRTSSERPNISLESAATQGAMS